MDWAETFNSLTKIVPSAFEAIKDSLKEAE